MRVLFLLLVILAGLAAASYAGARFTAGQVVGPNPHLGSLASEFAWTGITSLPGRPRGWILAYPEARGFGTEGAEIYVSVTGGLLGTWPEDLAERIEAQRSAEP
ncbi:MAG TPA: hypothetical protein VFU40_02325 [Gemmatimonadales bacterium]|nr:hypothetical protein [Gemmatimonadales bacterium]